MTRRLEDSWLKVESAAEKLNRLDAEIRDLIKPEAGWITRNVEEDFWKVVRFHVVAEPPRQWGVLVGEIAHALRSALDHLVYVLSEEGGGNPSDPKARTQWPIFTERGDYPGWRENMLRGVSDPNRTVVDWAQPFDRTSDGLAILSRLTDDDKHRRILPGFIFPEPVTLTVSSLNPDEPLSTVEIVNTAPPGVPLVDNAEIARVRLPDEPTRIVNVGTGVAFTVAFGTDRVTPPGLSQIWLDVSRIVERFEAFRP